MFSSIFSRDPIKAFEYEAQDVVLSYSGCSFWTLHKGIKKGSGEEFSIFVYDAQKQGESWLSAAKASLKRLKTMRHPNILTYVDGLETDKIVYIVTEPVTPLSEYLLKCTKKNDHLLAWGLFQIAKALSFLNETANLAHHNVSVNSVFVSKAGEWKLGGLDYVTPAESDSAPSLNSLKNYVEPPEYTRGGGGRKNGEKWSTDIWGYGVLVYQVFNGNVPSKDALKQLHNLPESLRPHYPSLISTDPRARISPTELINRCTTGRGFFQNPVIDAMNFLDEVQLKSPDEKTRFFGRLVELVESLPEEVCTYRVLPQLLNTFEFGPTDNSTLPILLKLGKGLKDDEYQKRIIPVVIKQFSSTDRAVRMQLLQQMKFYIDHLSSSIVNNQIFPNVANGFLDTNPAIREETVKSIVLLAPKLSSKNLNEEVMKHFARIQAKDDQGAIRTNTTVCIGKLAPCLVPDVRLKVLVSAFSRALRDPFPPCRVSGAVGFAVTFEYFSLKDVATRVLPSLVLRSVDPEKEVRDQVLKSVKLFMDRLEQVSEKPELKDEMESKVNAGSINVINTAANWAGWAVNSLTAKFYKGKPGDQSSQSNIAAKGEENGNLKYSSDQRDDSKLSPMQPMAASPVPSGGKSPTAASSSGWDEGIDDWSFLQDAKANLPNAPITSPVSGNADGWDDADWSTPISEAAPKSGIPIIKPPPPAGSVVKPSSNASPFADLNNEDIFSSRVPASTAKPTVKAAPSKAPNNSTGRTATTPLKPTTNAASSPKAGNQTTSWDSWDTWDTTKTGDATTLKPTTATKGAAKPMKLTAKSWIYWNKHSDSKLHSYNNFS
ncbi:N-terminal kinase-like protein [Paramacrobiotus metropolitanus]|uniref:N-terminal kinase-like protein n=1 Tax=Paramacrobiotus metropolitanus TaxID=2943436 RepID=UPI002445B78A|nr:N-terminal kinase-like protein [Paramacrobiotus metropolitanus]XP_055339834.1 N-terminal kinase-like protein [Paramacrobiotus metropolitanus]